MRMKGLPINIKEHDAFIESQEWRNICLYFMVLIIPYAILIDINAPPYTYEHIVYSTHLNWSNDRN